MNYFLVWSLLDAPGSSEVHHVSFWTKGITMADDPTEADEAVDRAQEEVDAAKEELATREEEAAAAHQERADDLRDGDN
jgi:predicted Zn-dependent peptidase